MSGTKVCIYGVGAIGGWFGAKLAAAGCNVAAVARGATLKALKEHGLRLHADGTTTAHQINCSDCPAELGVQDVVVIAVKAPALAQVAQNIAPLLGPDTIVLTAMNGVPWWFLHGLESGLEKSSLDIVDPAGLIESHIPLRHVIGCVVFAGCSVDEPGLIRHRKGTRLIVGEPDGAVSQRVTDLAALLTSAGFQANVSVNKIQEDIWFKLWGNMTMNPVSAITGATVDKIMDDELVNSFIKSVMLEAQAIGERIGLPNPSTPEERLEVVRLMGAFKTSMLQDHEASRPVELDVIVGAVTELGRAVGVATPFTDALFGMSRLQAQVRGLYPAANVPELK